MKKYTKKYRSGKVEINQWVLDKLESIDKDPATANTMSETAVEEMINKQKKRIDCNFNFHVNMDFYENKELVEVHYSKGLFAYLLSAEELEAQKLSAYYEKYKLMYKKFRKDKRKLTEKKQDIFREYLKRSKDIDFATKVFPECVIYLQNAYDERENRIKTIKKMYDEAIKDVNKQWYELYQKVRNKKVEV